MDDTNLLEDAARAIGRSINAWNTQHGVAVAVLHDGTFWQPLLQNSITDCMGDALRLAVKLDLQVVTSGPRLVQAIHYASGAYGEAEKEDDPYAATRRAIVLAAAEIGKGMP